MDLTQYDIILINTSAGKDSLATLDYVHALAVEQGVTSRLRAVHCDLGRAEWQGTRELAHQQCLRYGIALDVVSREQDLLDHVEQRGQWPSSTARFCTSDHKRDQVGKLITKLVDGFLARTYGVARKGQPAVRILSCLGLRADESPARKAKPVLERNKRATNGKRIVDNWLPIHAWSEAQVWDLIHGKSLPYHFAYDLGMPRLSCVFCIFAPEKALLLAGYHNPALLAEYVGVEQRINHSFKHKQPLVNIQAQLNAGYVPAARIDPSAWAQCA